MKTVVLSRVFLSKSFILNCQIASILAVILLLSNIADAAELPMSVSSEIDTSRSWSVVNSPSNFFS